MYSIYNVLNNMNLQVITAVWPCIKVRQPWRLCRNRCLATVKIEIGLSMSSLTDPLAPHHRVIQFSDCSARKFEGARIFHFVYPWSFQVQERVRRRKGFDSPVLFVPTLVRSTSRLLADNRGRATTDVSSGCIHAWFFFPSWAT